jgi:tetratricopeptide (TPR) repeat protein
MQTMVINHQKFKLPDVEFILSRYDMLTSVIDDKIKLAATDAKRKAKLLKIKRDIDDWLLKVVKPDCDFVRSNLAPRLAQNPNDLVMVKQIFSYMLQGKCTDDPLWIKTAKILFKEEKDFTIGKSLAYRYLSVDSLSLAANYLEQTLAVAPTKRDSSEINFYQGSLATKQGDKSGARNLFLTAVRLDKDRKEAYERIGDLYIGSFNECAQKQRQADDRAIYIAAFNYYLKAGNQRKMNLAKQSFPSKEDIFVVNYRAGDKIKVQCWINEEVVLQTRD